jgi:hypothetical protein
MLIPKADRKAIHEVRSILEMGQGFREPQFPELGLRPRGSERKEIEHSNADNGFSQYLFREGVMVAAKKYVSLQDTSASESEILDQHCVPFFDP